MSWSSVTGDEAEPSPETAAETADRDSDFHFDLSSALERMGEPRPTGAPLADPGARATAPIAAPAPPPHAPATPSPSRSLAPAPAPVPAPLTAPVAPAATQPLAPVAEPIPDPAVVPADAMSMAGPASVVTSAPAVPSDEPAMPDLPRRVRGAADGESAVLSSGDALPRRDASTPAPQPITAPLASTSPQVFGQQAVRAPAAFPGHGSHVAASVFDDAAPAPALPAYPSAYAPAAAQAPVIPPSMAKSLPTLPAANPVYAPAVAESQSKGPDISAVRAYQARADRQRESSKMFGRTFMAFVFLAALVAGALVFGRPLLYPDEWNPALTPYVDLIQTRSGGEFVEVVELNELAAEPYTDVALGATVGAEWDARLAEWRALGIASGSSDEESVSAAVVSLRPAVYDAASNTIYRATDADVGALAGSYEVALQELFLRQQGTPPSQAVASPGAGVLGVTNPQEIGTNALDRQLSGARPIEAVISPGLQTPLPLLYELVAVDRLGPALVAAAGDTELTYGAGYPSELLEAATPPATRSTPGAVPEGAEPIAGPESLGLDAWSLIWGNRLPDDSVDRLNSLVVGDSYRVVRQGGRVCVVATFGTATEADTTDVVAALARWALAAPAESAAAVDQTGPNLVELLTCDPGPTVIQPIDPTVVDDVLARQVARLVP